MGIYFGQTVNSQEMEIDIPAFMQAVEDVLNNAEKKMTDDEMKKILTTNQKMEQHQRAAESDSNKIKGEKYLAENKNKTGKIYVMISDGECQEGTTWESLLIAAKHKLDNLVVVVDYNKIQALSTLKDALPLENLSTKFKAFNWDCIKVKDGHSFKSLISSFKRKGKRGKPLAIIVNTIKGKGIKEFENDPIWHARQLKGKEIEIGKKRLGII